MVDLADVIGRYVDKVFDPCDPEFEEDSKAVLAISDQSMPLEARRQSLVEWLRRYGVWQGFRTEERTKTTEAIIKFADNRSQSDLRLSRNLVFQEFVRLEKIIAEFAPINKISERKRSVISLASKALWICYPYDTPIYDRNAFTALTVIKRLIYLESGASERPYESYLSAWFALYEKTAHLFDVEKTIGYPYKVRILDRFLWYLGEPNLKDLVRDLTLSSPGSGGAARF